MDSGYLDCMPHSIVVNSATTTLSGYGKITHSTAATTYSGLVQYKTSRVKDSNGQERLAVGHINMNATGIIRTEDLITLPDGTSPGIILIERLSDEVGQHHVKVVFGG